MLADSFRAFSSAGRVTGYRIPASIERAPAAAMPTVSVPEDTDTEGVAPDVEDTSTWVPLAYKR